MDRGKAEPPVFDRRSLLQAMAASLALAAAGGRRVEADERALPYVTSPPFVVPGKAKWYATSVGFAGYLQPVLGRCIAGRPVKLEGNAQHPATHGATDVFMQAALLDLYDPRRSQAPLHLGQPATWSAFDVAAAKRAGELDRAQGEGFRLLTGAVSSPTLLRQIADLQRRWPRARWHVWEPVGERSRVAATRRVLGRALQMLPDFAAARTVVSFDDDFLGPGPRQAMQARAWAERQPRLFVAEPTPSATGTRAQDRLIIASARMGVLMRALAHALGIGDPPRSSLSQREQKWLADAQAARPELLTVGIQHDPSLHGLALLINERLGGFGRTLGFAEPALASPPDGEDSFAVLVDDMSHGRVTTLMMLDVDPLGTAPTVMNFRAALASVPFAIHAGRHLDATAAACHWHLPLQHDLESWSDGRAPDGTAAIVQPLIRPFHDVRSPHVVLDRWLGGTASDHDLVRATWKDGWQEALLAGFIADSAPPRLMPTVTNRDVNVDEEEPSDSLALEVRPDATLWDGRYTFNAWLQETPKPLIQATWGNAILVSPALAKERGIDNGDEIRLRAGTRVVTGAALVMPGQEPRSLTMSFGDAVAFVEPASPWRVRGVSIEKTGARRLIASTQPTQDMTGFDFVRTVEPAQEMARRRTDRLSFHPDRRWDSPSWGMSIDLDRCIGCNACSVACMAENNVPVVGRELVAQGRQMHWIRIDHYHEGDATEPRHHFQPVPCMHCEQAPCEMGCPVNATVHSSDGLNLQVYNRCIGTRTCSAYCPYKVRRFNWFEYTGNDPETLRAMRNPDVTVRSRGVMEKCTYCIQRISAARIAAKIDGRPMRDGDVVTACQQACPTGAIVFGDITDPDSAVSKRKASLRDYSLLEEANTWPRTTYLARVRK
jgi:molybdopterin-containing oxidoreductase family iron-sulfur binding subunit